MLAALPRRARLIFWATAATATVLVALASLQLARQGTGPGWVVAYLGVLIAVAASWPLIVYQGEGSEALCLDEAFVILAMAMLPPHSVIVIAAGASVLEHLRRRRPPVKAVFNVSQMATASAAAVGTAHLFGLSPGQLSAGNVGALTAGAVVYTAVSALMISVMLRAIGQVQRGTWRTGFRTRLLLFVTLVVTGLLLAVAATAHLWAIAGAPILFVIVRQLLAGHFDARHDRDRILGLLDGAREIYGAMGQGKVRPTIEAVASRVLRGHAHLEVHRPAGDALAAALPDQSCWLTLTGRAKEEPFDEADERMINALAAVSAGALTNAALYAQVHQQRQQMETVLSSLAEGVCAFDAEGRPTFWNPAVELLLGVPLSGFDSESAIGQRLLAPVRRCIHSATPLNASASFMRSDGSALPVSYTCAPMFDGGRVTGAVLAFRDDTSRLSYEEQLSHHAFHDQLTGLANRRLFLDRLDQALRRAHRHGATNAVLFADVDRFKMINDSLGHQAGDRLLLEISKRLRTVVRDSDTVARFGGDEFTVLLEEVTDPREAEQMAERIVAAFNDPIQVTTDRDVIAGLSIGIAVSQPGDSADDLLHDADLAMYSAKAEGLGRWRHYQGGGGRSVEQLDLESDLRAALASGSIELHYQPLVSTASGRTVDFEALVRWPHPTRGMLQPKDFIPLAEETGLILPLGRLVLREACRQAMRFESAGGVVAGISVNLSARQFQDPNLVSDIQDALDATGLDPERLCLEVTETLAMHDIDWTINTLQRLKGLGVRLAIDDFGTGHSSLNYLKRFPVDVVKIDRCFVQDIENSVVDSAIVTAVIMLAQTLRITTVAEGVERPGQLAHLRHLGCPVVQGFFYSKALPSPELSTWLRSGHPAGAAVPGIPRQVSHTNGASWESDQVWVG